MSLDGDIKTFLDQGLGSAEPDDPEFPFVTLTYAQSLDARIAGRGGKQLRLSGQDSMRMTHQMRTGHDAIVVGIGTILHDNPRLTARDLSDPVALKQQPVPVVIDTYLRTPLDCKLIENHRSGTGRKPLLLCSAVAPTAQRSELENAGADVVAVASMNDSELLDMQAVLKELKKRGFKRVMIEGGAAVITTCLMRARQDGAPLVDAVVVTVAPTLVGSDGVSASDESKLGHHLPRLLPVATATFGTDAVFLTKLR